MSRLSPPILKTVLIVWWCVFFLSTLFPALSLEFLMLGRNPIGIVFYAFLHLNFFHLLINSIALILCGPLIENIITKRLNLQLVVLAVVVPGFFTLLIDLFFDAPVLPVLGGSGICYAYLFASAVLFPKKSISLFFVSLPLGLIAGLFFLYSLLGISLQLFGMSWNNQTAHSIHFLGGLVGFFVMGGFPRLALNNIGWIDFLVNRVKIHKRRRVLLEEDKLDQILGKISQDGMDSLSEKEHLFLLKMSKKKRKR